MRQIEMHAGDGVAHLLGLADQRVALVRERLEQAADADFVVVVGALERRHFVGDQRFELGRAGQRPLDAVAHGGDLAADGLADGDDGIAGDLFRLGEPHGDARHRLRDDAHLLRAPHHVGDARRRTATGASTKPASPIMAGMPAGPASAPPADPADRGMPSATPQPPRRARTPWQRRRRPLDGRCCRLCRICPMDWRSSLAANWPGRASSAVRCADLRTGPFPAKAPMRTNCAGRAREASAAVPLGRGYPPARRLRSGPAGWPSWPRPSGPSASSVVRHVGRRLTRYFWCSGPGSQPE